MTNFTKSKFLLTVSTVVTPLLILSHAMAQEAPQDEFEEIVVLGSRVVGRTVEQSSAPIDSFSAESLGSNGFTQLGQALQTIAPSFNFTRTQVSDGSDLFRPATLRGLQPDQTLILVNQKRRHNQSALGRGAVGSGSAGTDLNAIPLFALKNVQVLRDGAAAQYGSDAIAGVINLQLKDSVGETSGYVQWGQTYEGDGALLTLAANTGFEIGDDGGFVNLTGEYRDGETTNRSDPGRVQADGNPAQWKIGDADTKFVSFFVNSALPVGEDGELYVFGGYSKRDALGAGFYRDFNRAERNVPQVYPNGFLPRIGNTAKDLSVAAGYRHDLNDVWSSDISVVYGDNAYTFDSFNAINSSIAADYLARNPGASDSDIAENAGPTEGFSGGLGFDQLTFSGDIAGAVDIGEHLLNVAFGGEYRAESYQIIPGSLASYSCGIDDNPPNGILSVIDGVTPATCGFQAFPGFRPESATDVSRNSFAFYADLETNLSDTFLLGVAARYENFQNVGGKLAGKATARWDVSETFALRGSVSSGFRAPSLQQSGFTAVTTGIGASGVLEQSFSAPAGSAFPKALGVDGLNFETSTNFGIGLVFMPTKSLSIAIDAYRIKIKGRMVRSGRINAGMLASLPSALTAFNALNVNSVFLFTNAVNSTTQGIDLVATYSTELGEGDLDLTFSANVNDTNIDNVNTPNGIAKSVIFSSVAASSLTGGQPKSRATFSADYNVNKFNAVARVNYFGKTEIDFFAQNHIGIPNTQPTSIVESAFLVDLEVSYDFTDNFSFAVGGNNIFNQVPDELKNNEVLNIITGGAAKYPLRAVPYGFNGGQYYVRINFKF